MTTIQTGIAINNPNVHQIDPGKLQKFDNIIPFDENKFKPENLEDRQQRIDLQNSLHQSTVIERNGDVIASFGENGWQQFQNNDFDRSFIGKTEAQIIDALKQKYGATLTINTYPNGQGPTAGEIFERTHGYPPPRLVDYNV